jgi:hypothetical protein
MWRNSDMDMLVAQRLRRLMQRCEIVGMQRFQAQRARQTITFQSLIPACRIVAQVCAPSGALACWIKCNTPICVTHQAYQPSLGIRLATRNACTLWHMLRARSFGLLFHTNRQWMMHSGLRGHGAHHPCTTLFMLHRQTGRCFRQRPVLMRHHAACHLRRRWRCASHLLRR